MADMTPEEAQAQLACSSSSQPQTLAQHLAQSPPPKPKPPAPSLPEAHTGAVAQVAQMAPPPDTASTQPSDAQTVAQVTQKAPLPEIASTQLGEAQPGASAHVIPTKAPPANLAKAPPANLSFTQPLDVQQGASAQVACPPPPPPRALAQAACPPPPPSPSNNCFDWGPYKGKGFEYVFCNHPEFVGQCLRTGETQEAWLQFLQQRVQGPRVAELEQKVKQLNQDLVERDQRITQLETMIGTISAICKHA